MISDYPHPNKKFNFNPSRKKKIKSLGALAYKIPHPKIFTPLPPNEKALTPLNTTLWRVIGLKSFCFDKIVRVNYEVNI